MPTRLVLLSEWLPNLSSLHPHPSKKSAKRASTPRIRDSADAVVFIVIS